MPRLVTLKELHWENWEVFSLEEFYIAVEEEALEYDGLGYFIVGGHIDLERGFSLFDYRYTNVPLDCYEVLWSWP